IAVTWIIGGAVLLAGIATIAEAFQAHSLGAGIGDFLWGLLYAVAGLLMLLHPIAGLSFLTMLLAFFFFLAGTWKVMAAWRLRPRQGWGLVMTSGVLSLLFGAMVLASWPFSGAWAIGTLVGVELIFDGWTMVTLGTTLRQIAKVATAPAA